jgi:MoaA/NifB/PqqE/SkfB family radical SAM enzyme
LLEAARFGVRTIYFTGGEVFVNQDVLKGHAERNEEFVKSLSLALEIASVEILTNGRKYIRNHLEALRTLREKHGDRLRLRISLESPDPAVHDSIRGRGTFAETIQTIQQLGAAGFVPIITAERPLLAMQEDKCIREAYQSLFPAVQVSVNVIENMIEMGHQLRSLERQGVSPTPEVFITANCFVVLNKSPESLMCHFSRCIQKIEGEIRYYPCPVIYDDRRFELGRSLEESLRRVYLAHKNCYDYCMKGAGATCRTRPV